MSYQDQDHKGLGGGPVRRKNATQNVWETLEADGRFQRFLAAAREANLEKKLRGAEWITVFAVPDPAIGDEPEELIRTLVPQHIVRGYQTTADLRMTSTVRSLDGAPVTVAVENGRAKFGDAEVDQSDVACNNGMIHVLGRLMKACAYSG